MRIQRALARAGVASRRRAEELVDAGRVLVNGAPAQRGQSVDPDQDAISVDGRPVALPAEAVWVVLYKPAGVMTTRRDPRGRRTVFDFVAPAPGLTYVGRLDYLTEGVLLLTTDGAAAHRLTHPSGAIERVYVATVRGNAPEAVRRLERGVELEDGFARPEQLTVVSLGAGRWDLTMSIAEGRNREVRRLCRAVGLFVDRLVRVRFGPVTLGRLAPGQARPLTGRERDIIEALTNEER